MNSPDDLAGLIPVAEAAKRIPSHVPGKRLNVATLTRWVLKGRIRGVKRGRFLFIYEADLPLLFRSAREAVRPPVTIPAPPQNATPEWLKERLRKHGIKI